MKNLQKSSLLLLFLLIISCTENTDNELTHTDPTTPVETISYKEKAKQTFDLVQQNYKISSTGLYLENFPKQAGDRESSYLWSLDGLLSGVNQLKAIGYKDQVLNAPFLALEKYYDTQRLPTAYPAFPVQYGLDDRFYDDNAIVALDLIEDYQITKNEASLDRVKKLVEFSLTGEDNVAGGGMYWVEEYRYKPENDNCMKAVCASAFTTTYLLKLYQITKNDEYLKFAKRIYVWLTANMKDPVDNLFWNDIRIRDSYINKTKWTYNSGAMITNNVLLYEITKDETYLTEARTIAASSYTVFTRRVDNQLFFPDHDSWFNVCLFRGYLDLLKHDPIAQNYVNTFISNADYAWAKARNSYGLFYEDWSGIKPGRDKWLLQQAALIEIYGRIALLKGETE
ncbi:glycoside hydrolase family 76 protein [Flavobacterium sp. 5]|uniref:glycoside hydrolase family 76 protein n=1 Tax=Flavobacterium sp. 5 TaxID=2035199 RepID=UPI000C2BC822|nr:glycoside hydrolase family 76 protein [Flavobacterium sp. 5]PKB18836.1 glycosyl hydrolase family 76 [Flavobacterium sp. 5]